MRKSHLFPLYYSDEYHALFFFSVNGTGSSEWNWVEQMLVIATGVT